VNADGVALSALLSASESEFMFIGVGRALRISR